MQRIKDCLACIDTQAIIPFIFDTAQIALCQSSAQAGVQLSAVAVVVVVNEGRQGWSNDLQQAVSYRIF